MRWLVARELTDSHYSGHGNRNSKKPESNRDEARIAMRSPPPFGAACARRNECGVQCLNAFRDARSSAHYFICHANRRLNTHLLVTVAQNPRRSLKCSK
jgi:hypothetical protein